jgi:hypothetical protein
MDQVRITRDAGGANIEYAEENVSGVHLVLDPEKMAAMSDEQILEAHNTCIEAIQASRDSQQWTATEIPPGMRQVKRDRRSGHLLPRGHVLRCHVSDGGVEEDDPVAIYIDNEEYSLREFGEMLSLYAGWGMRVVFVPDDEVHEEPVIIVRKRRKGR